LRKSRALLELMSLKSILESSVGGPEFSTKLSTLVEKIEKNSYILRIEVAAARKVSDLIANAIKDGQSDGTYSEYDWRGED
jgi:hypothetical protein